MQECPHESYPQHHTKSKLNGSSDSAYHDPTKYQSIIGVLQYLTFTRPNISYVVQQMCLFMHDQKIQHLFTLKQIICDMHGTVEFGLHLYSSSIDKLVSYTDANWVGCPNIIRSTSR